MDEAFAAACGTAADGTALKKNQAKTPWTKQEDQAILEGVKVHGHKWSKIAETLPSTVPRTDDATRNRWHRLMNKAGRLANDRPADGETDDVSPPKRPRAQPTAAQEAAAEEAAGKGGKHGDMWTAEEDLTIDHAVRPNLTRKTPTPTLPLTLTRTRCAFAACGGRRWPRCCPAGPRAAAATGGCATRSGSSRPPAWPCMALRLRRARRRPAARAAAGSDGLMMAACESNCRVAFFAPASPPSPLSRI